MTKKANIKISTFLLLFTVTFFVGAFISPSISQGAGYLGHQKKKGCVKCHMEQYKSWKKTVHAKAMKTLQPGVKSEAKTKAKLDPNKDYSQDEKCLKCHSTGFGAGGYEVGNAMKMKKFKNIGCESCHGPGKKFMMVKNNYENSDFPREEVIAAGMKYGEEKVCRECHNNSSDFFDEATFNYGEMLKRATHKHYKQYEHPTRYAKEKYWEYESDE